MSTIVLVGGSFLGAWAWERVVPPLAAAGHDVHALTLTGFGDRAHLATPQTGVAVHAQDVVAAISTARLEDVVLVGHSYAGVPVTVAAARIPERIARVVYLAAVVPTAGRSLFEDAGPEFHEAITGFVEAAGDPHTIPVFPEEVLDLYYGEHGLSAADKAWFRERAVPQPLATYTERTPPDLSAAERLPRTFVQCLGDGGEPPVAAGTPGWEVTSIDTGHWPMITKPVELAALLDEVARQPVTERAGRA